MSQNPTVEFVEITRRGGSLAVMLFVTKVTDNGRVVFARKATDGAIAVEIAGTHPNPVSWRRIEASEVSQDRYFVGCWITKDGKPSLDFTKVMAMRQRVVAVQ